MEKIRGDPNLDPSWKLFWVRKDLSYREGIGEKCEKMKCMVQPYKMKVLKNEKTQC